MTNKQWPRNYHYEREWTEQEQALWRERYAEVVEAGWKSAPKSIEELVDNYRIIAAEVPAEHRDYFTRVLLTSGLMFNIGQRIIALEAKS